MPIPSSAKTIGKNAVIPGRETFCVVNPQTGGAATIEPFEAPRISKALTQWVNDGRRKDVALMVGGPKHMELVALPPSGNGVVYFHHSPAIYFDASKPPSVECDFHAEQYTRVRVEDVGELPFDIYEHESVRGANVQRRAEQLDRELPVADKKMRDAERDAGVHQNAEAAARVRRAAAEQKVSDASDALHKLYNERKQIEHDYGI